MMVAYRDIALADVAGDSGLFLDGDWIETKDQDPNGDVRLIQLADIGVGEYLDRSSRFLTSEKAAELKCTFLQPGDVLIARMPDPLGRACIFPGDPRPSVTAVDVCIVRPDPSEVDAAWLKWAINSARLRAELDRFATGTTRKRISRKNLGKIPLQLPPLSEQRRIAAILDKADAVRRKRQQTFDLADRFLRSAFLDLFGDPVTNPKGWPARKLGKFADIRSGVTKGRKLGDAETIAVPYMRVANVQDGTLDLSDIKEIEIRPDELERFSLRKGDLLLTEGGDPDKLGRGSVWTGEIDPCVHQNHIFSVRIDSTIADPYYLSALISSAYGKRHFLRIGKQTTGIATINKTQLRAFPALLPPVELQRDYAAVVARFGRALDRLMETFETHEKLASTLTQRAFRGEL